MNYEGVSRMNYVKVVDVTAWKQFCTRWGLQFTENSKGVGFLSESPVPTALPGGDEPDVPFLNELATHLQDEEVAVVEEVGREGMRYLTGYAWAINNKGRTRSVTIDRIYKLAAQLGKNVSDVAY
jgi:hypothetical protein